jgi:hypothetical protein
VQNAAALLFSGDDMSDVKKFPGHRWHPETGEMRVFQKAEDVPARWLDFHPGEPLNAVPADAEKRIAAENTEKRVEKPAAIPLSRQQVVADLQRRGVAFQRNATTKVLYDLLVAEVERSAA